MRVEKISWDEDTVDHISRHSVTPEEVEEVLFNDSDAPLLMRGKESRYLAYGQTNAGRYLLIVLVTTGRKTRIITSRDMTSKEKKLYRRKRR